MAIEYRLTLEGDIPLEQVAALAVPEADEVLQLPGSPRVLTADLNERLGYLVTIFPGRDGYYDAEDDNGGLWEWEPEVYVNVMFHMRKNEQSNRGTLNMVAAVARILDGRPEDAALVLNGNWLLLIRVGGLVRKCRSAAWWSHYGVNDLIRE